MGDLFIKHEGFMRTLDRYLVTLVTVLKPSRLNLQLGTLLEGFSLIRTLVFGGSGSMDVCDLDTAWFARS